MKALDWERVLKEHHVPYVTSGPNIGRGELGVRCPFCGSADPSQHMGINIETGYWSCWRNRAQHSGKSPLRLLMKLLGVPYARARTIAGFDESYVDPEGFDAMAARLLSPTNTARPAELRRRSLHLDDGFEAIRPHGRTRHHWEYLQRVRGFDSSIAELCEFYGLCAGVSGEWHDRVILPYYQDRQLVTWTGRAIAPSRIRYRDLSREESIVPPKETLFNHDAMLDDTAKVLAIVEGPMDALKLDLYGRRFGVRAVALSTNSISDAQTFLLTACRIGRIVVMMDNATPLGRADSTRLMQSLSFLDQQVIGCRVPCGAKDAGELRPSDAEAWAHYIVQGELWP